ncbi:MAG: hybrid sensor histidine kinase/response regulator [Xanthomonadaceae bacterium]|jgi:Na+/proline symporter/CheY-like chemotaxis protein|nr:hybrid sensor histidine kinase/response regulator [Xanthomonadaceae bacterium]
MFSGLTLIAVCVAYLGVLFLVAWAGDRRPLYPTHHWLRPQVYALALAVYCTSWTFYGAVGSAATSGINYLAIYLGPALLFIAFGGLFRRVVTITHDRNITSIADFIASRYGKSQHLAALVTLIALTAAVPYVALQFKAVAMSLEVMAGSTAVGGGAWIADGTFYVALVLALFAILFGTRVVDVTEHHHGLMLAIALESLVKLLAFVAVGLFAWMLLRDAPPPPPGRVLPIDGNEMLTLAFLSQTLLAFTAALCLPRQFQVGAVECENVADVGIARWAFPGYLAVFSLLVIPIASAGLALAPADVHPDRFVLWLPLSQGAELLALFAFLGGFSAATGMIIVESVALATMVSNELVMPTLSRVRGIRLAQRGDLSRLVLWVRRLAILGLMLAAFGYYRMSDAFPNLASVGLLAFVAVAQFMPAIVAGLYIRNASAAGAKAGLLAGFGVWLYALFLPTLAGIGLLPAAWLVDGPFGLHWLRPHALFGLDALDPVTHGTLWSLLANVVAFALVSRWRRPSVSERFRARAFLVPGSAPPNPDARLAGRASVGDLLDLAARILGEDAALRAFDEYARVHGRPMTREATADRGLLQHVERVLAGAIGASSARLVLTSALRGSGMELDEVASLLDEASQELRFSRGLLASTFEHMAQGLSVVDREQRLVAWNRRYAELFDYPADLLYIGRPVADLVRFNAERGLLGPGDVEDLVQRRVWHLRMGRPHVFLRERPDGRVIESRGTPLPDGGYLMTFTDVTDYKRVEHELREATERLEHRVAERTRELSNALGAQKVAQLAAEAANQSKTRFVAAASHDLLQPLNAARLFASALRARPGIDPEPSALGERIDTALRAAEELLDGLLDISRLDAGAQRVQIEVFPVAELFDTLRAQFGGLAGARGLALRIRGLPLHVRSDRRLLRRVLQNLVSNALRYTQSGGVLLAARRRGGVVRFEVWDSGPGIASEHQQRIFEEFQRLDQASPWGEKGLGLGLSICERIARLLGHRLGLRSRPGTGSCFSIDVPLGDSRQATPATPAAATAASLPPMRVLCLDNDRDILDGMRALLERWGVEVVAATTIDEALARVRERVPDAILADYHLHGRVEGLDALDELRAIADVPGALITADASDTLAAAARERGYALLRKPVKPAALRALLAALAQQREVAAG